MSKIRVDVLETRDGTKTVNVADLGTATASNVANTPAGNIAATNVQAAINELDTEKFAKTGGNINGNALITGGVLGYGVGAGGTATQTPTKTATVTINKLTGAITTASDALAGGAYTQFVFYNSHISYGDLVHVQTAGGVNGVEYQAWVSATDPGVCVVCLKNNTASPRSEAVNISFAIFKVATS